jgi:carbon-monoxide dehydrogenase iron sulfur subunit
MSKVLFTTPDRCVGCMACVMACSMKQGEAVGPAKSMILPIKLRTPGINIPVVCRHCVKPLCADVCPMGAISRNEETGAMLVDSDLCIGCGMCVIACPLGGISLDTELGHSVKCDLCQGDPECVKACTYRAIEYLTPEEVAQKTKTEAVGKLATMLEKIAY